MANWLHESCGRCGRKLKTRKSMEQGFGPVCYRKHLADIELAQMTIEDVEKNEPDN